MIPPWSGRPATDSSQTASLATGSLFLGILGLMEVGRRLGQRRAAEDAEGARAGVGAIEGAVYGLLGLLTAFSFSGAAERFAGRRALIVEEANAIGTAYLRVDLLPEEAQAAMRDRFRRRPAWVPTATRP